MRVEWDYTEVATSYLKRPPYAATVIAECLRVAGGAPGMLACDVGAGTGNLTLPLLERGLTVVALEPNPAMRRLGRERTRGMPHVHWLASLGECTAQRASVFDLVTFGSSFNVVDGREALGESARLLKPGGWLVCLWNHRNLDDPLQARIEAFIRERIVGYAYGARREDQTPILGGCGFFSNVLRLEGEIVHRVSVDDCLEAWRSHLTLRRQAGAAFPAVLAGIRALVEQCRRPVIEVPYTTRAWMARSVPATGAER